MWAGLPSSLGHCLQAGAMQAAVCQHAYGLLGHECKRYKFSGPPLPNIFAPQNISGVPRSYLEIFVTIAPSIPEL